MIDLTQLACAFSASSIGDNGARALAGFLKQTTILTVLNLESKSDISI